MDQKGKETGNFQKLQCIRAILQTSSDIFPAKNVGNERSVVLKMSL